MGYDLGLTHDEISNKASIQRENRKIDGYIYKKNHWVNVEIIKNQ